jgi:predicted nucleotidyltransferase
MKKMANDYALNIARSYIDRVKEKFINFKEAWVFGSLTKGNFNENSDIDVAVVFSDNVNEFEQDVELMYLRTDDELLIEPHSFDKLDFNLNNPFAEQVLKYGIKLT